MRGQWTTSTPRAPGAPGVPQSPGAHEALSGGGIHIMPKNNSETSI